MMTAEQIIRSIENQEHRRLVGRLLSNGRCLSRRAHEILHSNGALEPSAIGLGLQRICELTYWPLPAGAEIAHRLMWLQRRDGLFGAAHSTSPQDQLIAGSAVALRGLIDWATAFAHREDERSLLQAAIHRGLTSIASSFDEAPSASSREVSWAVVLWQLGDCDIASECLPLRSMRERVAASSPELLRDDLTRLALTMAA